MNYIKAFIVGGLLCIIAQFFIDKTKVNPARILVSYVVLGVILTAIGIYEPLVKFAGCGATTPLTGFGYSLAKGVQKAISENGPIGIITGGLTGTAGGITCALVFGYIVSLIFKGHPK
ncbi:MAG: stage V sporulation protein AE [Ruminococcaceae bacterium]|nr:stage V sporulation protein AE [Oscillospiraceae bacterium]